MAELSQMPRRAGSGSSKERVSMAELSQMPRRAGSGSSKELPVPGLFLHGVHVRKDSFRPIRPEDASKHFLGAGEPPPEWPLPSPLLDRDLPNLRLGNRRIVGQDVSSATFSLPLMLTRVLLGRDRATGLPLLVLTARPATGLWLVLVSGDEAAALFMLQLVGERGAIRSDFFSVYRLASAPLGRGSTAMVFSVTSLISGGFTSGEMVAKVASTKRQPVFCPSLGISNEVQQEVAMLTSVQAHPGVVRFHGLFSGGNAGVEPATEGSIMLMERCGESIYGAVRAGGPFFEARAREIASGLCSALAHVHSCGVLHRDVKPDNVLLGGDGRPVLADFGIACLASDRERRTRRCGSPGYVAPEVILDEPYSYKVDCFSAGATLFFLLSGEKAFGGQSVTAMFRNTVEAPVTFSQPCFDEVSAHCKDFILLLLKKKPKQRLSSSSAQGHPWIAAKDCPRAAGQDSMSSASTASPVPCGTSRTRSSSAGGGSGDVERLEAGNDLDSDDERQGSRSHAAGLSFGNLCGRLFPGKAAAARPRARSSSRSAVQPFGSDGARKEAGAGKSVSGLRGLARRLALWGGGRGQAAEPAEAVADASEDLKAAADLQTFDSIAGMSTATTWATPSGVGRPFSRQVSPEEDPATPAQQLREAEEELNCVLEEAEALLIE